MYLVSLLAHMSHQEQAAVGRGALWTYYCWFVCRPIWEINVVVDSFVGFGRIYRTPEKALRTTWPLS